jgi:hypothetical protein
LHLSCEAIKKGQIDWNRAIEFNSERVNWDVNKLPIDKEFEKIRKAIKAIGSKLPLNNGLVLVNEIRRVLVEKGYDEQWCMQSRAHLAYAGVMN